MLGGYLPQRRANAPALDCAAARRVRCAAAGSGDREISTTMALVRMLQTLLKDKHIGKHIVPIVPDEARTFGMEGMFRQIGIYSSMGQLYTPQDADQLMFYKEDKKGQILEEGINEGGALCSLIAAGTAYANHNVNMVPFYIYYSMFGFQRVGDFIWAGGDSQARGFLIGGTAGRTTLAGEGLQHQDGHSQLLSTTVPNCVSYDPTFAYELAVIVQDGLRRMYAEQEDIFYYITCMNENYAHPAMPKGVEQGILKGMYLLQIGGRGKVRVNLLGAGTILREVIAAAEILEKRLRRAGGRVQRAELLGAAPRCARCGARELLQSRPAGAQPYVRQCLGDRTGPFIAATDYMKIVPDQIRQWVPGRYIVLGTDGYGRSDSRAQLRRHFEVDRAAHRRRVAEGARRRRQARHGDGEARMKKFGIDPDKPNPVTQ